MQELKGVGVAIVTPFYENGKVDYASLEKLVKHLHQGADYLVVMGTTGESATLSEEEHFAVLDFVLEINKKKLPVVYGIGGNNTALVATKMQEFDNDGVVAFLSASPHYNKPTQEGIYQHYKLLSAQSAKPIIIYNVPGRTASNILPETTLRIARDCKNVVGIKEAAGSIVQVMELVKGAPENFLVISGDDALVFPHMCCGGQGIISVLANAYPAFLSDIVKLVEQKEIEQAREINHRIMPLAEAIFQEGNPAGIKEVLRHLGICDHHVRLPLVPASKSLSDKLYRLVAELGS